MSKATLTESRWGSAILVLIGILAVYFALEVEFTSYLNRGREPFVLICGVFLCAMGLGRAVRPASLKIGEREVVVCRLLRRELSLPWTEIAGFYEKYPGGIGINLKPKHASFQWGWVDGSDPDEVFVYGLWSNRSKIVAHLNAALANQASSSMSQ